MFGRVQKSSRLPFRGSWCGVHKIPLSPASEISLCLVQCNRCYRDILHARQAYLSRRAEVHGFGHMHHAVLSDEVCAQRSVTRDRNIPSNAVTVRSLTASREQAILSELEHEFFC
jgi:hypothetical protein